MEAALDDLREACHAKGLPLDVAALIHQHRTDAALAQAVTDLDDIHRLESSMRLLVESANDDHLYEHNIKAWMNNVREFASALRSRALTSVPRDEDVALLRRFACAVTAVGDFGGSLMGVQSALDRLTRPDTEAK